MSRIETQEPTNRLHRLRNGVRLKYSTLVRNNLRDSRIRMLLVVSGRLTCFKFNDGASKSFVASDPCFFSPFPNCFGMNSIVAVCIEPQAVAEAALFLKFTEWHAFYVGDQSSMYLVHFLKYLG